ncbi:hypothetical protein [Luteolibacter soli]|uniref:Uncharacterized protein n=1 Tax=Luteolibacter soli TaxID=3135280 RepID=A0ABU9APG7_9BACT
MVLLLFFSVLAAAAGFIAGYSLASKDVPLFSSSVHPPTAPASPLPPSPAKADPTPEQEPPVVSQPPQQSPATPPAPAEPLPQVPPQPAEPDPAEPEPPPLKVIAAPEAALKAFLSAPDWPSRAKHVLHPERVTKKMEAYYAAMPDGPTNPLSLVVDASHDDPEKGADLFTYLIGTETFPKGFPVAIAKTPEGWRVDWETFVEFRDDHFRRFATGEGSDAGSFHLLVRNTHYFDPPFPGSTKLTAFRVDPPLPERDQYAFVPTGSDLHKTLAAATEWGRPCAPVLQLARKKHPDGKTHLEITAILAPNWRPQE